MELLGQIIGFLFLFFFILSFQFKDKKKLIVFRIVSKIIASIHYIMIGALTGSITQFMDIFPSYFSYQFDHNNKAKQILVPVFVFAFILIGIFTYNDIFDLLPIIGCILSVIFLFMKGTKYIRISQFFISPMFLTYNIINHSYAGIINEVLVLTSCIIATIRIDKKKKSD